MKWQNLLQKKCPKCDAEIQPLRDRTILYACIGCDFVITRRKYYEILTDECHVMRRFLSNEELEKLTTSIEKLYAN